MIKTIVTFLRQNEVEDIFKVVKLNTVTHQSKVDYKHYPRSMNMTEDDVRDELED